MGPAHGIGGADILPAGTYPTHVAVALKYDKEKMAAPVVVAKGYDEIAQKIKQIARDNGVMLVENVPIGGG
jgi:flagellar biosynthetic protein FlhB